MIDRRPLFAFIASLALGSLMMPAAAVARGAGMGAAHPPFAFRPALHPRAPFFQGAFHPIKERPLAFRRFPAGHAAFGTLPWWTGFDDQGPYYYYPASAAGSLDTDDGAAAQRPVPVAVYRPGCRTQQQTVPAESGGTRTINITRCY